MTNLHTAWNPDYVLLSYGISFLGSYVSVSLSEQYRLCNIDGEVFLSKTQLLVLISCAIAGVSIWCMHFIGMGAMTLFNPIDDKETLMIAFDTGLTAASLVAAIILLSIGIFIATNDRVFVRDSTEFSELLLSDARRLSIKDAKEKSNLTKLAMFKGLRPIIIGGILTGAGVCVMHYIGMTAMIFDGTMSWDIRIIVGSVIIAILVSVIGLWIMFRLLPLHPKSEFFRVTCAAIISLAVCSMHYTGMTAPTFIANSNKHAKTNSLVVNSSTAVIIALFIGIFILSVCLILAGADLRYRYSRLSRTQREIESLINDFKRSHSSSLPITVMTLISSYDKIIEKKSIFESKKSLNIPPRNSTYRSIRRTKHSSIIKISCGDRCVDSIVAPRESVAPVHQESDDNNVISHSPSSHV